MPLDRKLTKHTTTSPVLTSFNFTDIADGTGVITLYAGGTLDPTNQYFLTQNQVRTVLVTTSQDSTGSTDVDFDLTAFNATRTPKGTATIEANLNITTYSGTLAARLGARLYHWDGSTETAISAFVDSADKTDAITHGVFLLLPITNEKVFKIGDTLRLKMTITNEDGGNINCNFDFNPDGSTPLILNMPFELPE